MKATIEQFKGLLKAAGVQHVEIVDDDSQSEYNQKEALSLIDNSRMEILKPRIIEAEADNIKREHEGKIHALYVQQLSKQLGISRTDLEKKERVEDRIAAAKEVYNSQMEGDTKEIENRFQQMLTAKEQEKLDALKEWQDKYENLNTQYKQREMVEHLYSKIQEAPTRWDKRMAAAEILKHAQEAHDIEWDENSKTMKFFEKGKKGVPAVNGSNTIMNEMDIARAYLEPRNGWEKDMRNVKPDNVHGGKEDKGRQAAPQNPRQSFLEVAKEQAV